VHIKMTLFGLYLIQYQPHLSIFESFWFDGVKNLKSSLWLKKDRRPKIKFKWRSIKSFTASQIKMI
jgi:hypothetical protein